MFKLEKERSVLLKNTVVYGWIQCQSEFSLEYESALEIKANSNTAKVANRPE